MQKVIITSLTVLSLFSGLNTPQLAAAETCTTLTATGGPNYAPANWMHDGDLIGYMPATLKEIGDRLSIDIKVSPSGHWNRALANTASGQFDIVMGLSKNADRVAVFDYTAPVWNDPVSIIVWNGSDVSYDGTWQSLVPYQGGVRLGARFNPDLNPHVEQDLKIRRVPNHESMYRQLERGRIDYFIGGQFSAMVNAADMGVLENIKILEPAIGSDEVYLAFSKKSPCRHLVDTFSKVITDMQATNTIGEFVEHYKNQRLGQISK